MSQSRIYKLTPFQVALIPVIRDEWIKIALNTSPTDKQKAESAIRLAYKCFQLKQPQQIFWFDNPLIAINWITANRHILQKSFINYDIWCELEQKIIYFAIERSIEITVEKRLICVLDNNVLRVFRQILDAVWDAVVEQEFFEENRDFIELNISINSNGMNHVDYLAFYAYLQALKVDCSLMKGMWEAAKHCGFWWDFKDIAIATPKPSMIALDNQSRLHAEGKPAVAYEGFNIYAYHGVRLPEKYGKVQK